MPKNNAPRLPADKAAKIQKALLTWYQAHHRSLPWRQSQDPYRIWVSEIMLQQTQVNTVIAYFNRFVATFPDIFCLAAADLQDVLKCWEGLGYYARARNLHKAARELVDKADGRIPDQWDAFRKLPGVGDYIAAAVLSIAFGKPWPAVDGNVKRVLARLFAIDTPVNQSAAHRQFRAVAARLLDKTSPGIFNQALIEVGALVCKPANPDCGACPVAEWCRARGEDQVSQYPVRIKKAPVPEYRMVIGVIVKGQRLLIVQRPAEAMLGGLWEFPGGVRQAGESGGSACLRNIREAVGLEVAIGSRLTTIRHAYTHFKIVADVYVCRYTGGRVRRNGPPAHCWVSINALSRYPFPGSHHKFIPLLMDINDRLSADSAFQNMGKN
ncbi:MAG: A/G-specific adenine glycosylase [Desulfobacterales bacterium]|nr:A/G-specific adenine glycosylase [Desulfobacterales bacterium]